jgi:hypothetical protein
VTPDTRFLHVVFLLGALSVIVKAALSHIPMFDSGFSKYLSVKKGYRENRLNRTVVRMNNCTFRVNSAILHRMSETERIMPENSLWRYIVLFWWCGLVGGTGRGGKFNSKNLKASRWCLSFAPTGCAVPNEL